MIPFFLNAAIGIPSFVNASAILNDLTHSYNCQYKCLLQTGGYVRSESRAT
jgi:hypothetical protein